MAGLVTHLVKVTMCAQAADYEKFVFNIIGLLFIIGFLSSITSAALWAFQTLTKSSMLRVRDTIITVKLIFAFVMLYPWLIQSSNRSNPFLTCPIDLLDFACEITIYVMCLEAILRFSGVRDWRCAATAFAVVLGVAVTVFNKYVHLQSFPRFSSRANLKQGNRASDRRHL